MQASRNAGFLFSGGRTLKRWLAAGLQLLLEGISARAQGIAGRDERLAHRSSSTRKGM